MDVQIQTHANPLISPASSCIGVWAPRMSRDVHTAPVNMTMQGNANDARSAVMYGPVMIRSIMAIQPPIAAPCALIFHLRLISSDTSIDAPAPAKNI